ncbi:chitin disaccharide deacetylase [Bacillus mesophilum]|uniref:Chitin disaccharide deacetylase n=1 Tax=Bacillus mesophilum TaxID=1071718 RepID=A0A7V7RQK2_9BACI|nr:chitin disaccharide deacetylase [Bacillus mesophilum]KAB2335734.1 chitin disaccharide deacetylase [Bacillus mesophilum]
MRILLNADDYGLTKGVTDGIIQSHVNGIVQSATLMMNGLAASYAVEQARLHPSLQVGIHLVLTWGKPIAAECDSLTNEKGLFKFKSSDTTLTQEDLLLVEKEWQSQIEAFQKTGLPLHHIDSHHHVHGWSDLKEVIIRLAKKYKVPVRFADSIKNESDILLTQALWTDFYADGVDGQLFNKLKDLPYESIEVMTHPAVIDDELRTVSSYVHKRKTELELLCSMKLPDWAQPL